MNDPRGPQTPEQRLEAARAWAGRPPAFGGAPASVASAEMTDRLHGVIAAAERAAEAIRFDAEQQARRHLADARETADRLTAERLRVISQLTDDLIEQAGVVRQHSEQMVGSLQRAIEAVNDRLGETATPQRGPATPVGAERSPDPARGSGPVRSPADALPPTPILDAALGSERPSTAGSEPEPDAVRRAVQLADEGHGREAIAAAIAAEFGCDPEPVLARALGG